MARRLARLTSALLGTGAAIFMLWIGIDELSSDLWFGLLVLACAPVLVGIGVVLPEFVAARDPAARARLIAHPLWWACQSAFVSLAVVAGGAYVAGWLGVLVGAVVGGVLAWQGLDTRRVLESSATTQPPEPKTERENSPTRRQWMWLIVKAVLLWLAFVAIAAGAGYAAFGHHGAILAALLMLVVIVAVYGVAYYVWRRAVRARTVDD